MRYKLTIAFVILATISAGFATMASPAEASPGGPANTCEPKKASSGYSGKIDVQGNHKSVTVSAPAGNEIYRYCAKAGSAKHGGPEYVNVDPAQSTVVISHSSDKDLSHYAYWYRPTATTTTSTTQPSTVPSTTSTTSTTVPSTTSTTVPSTTSTTVPSTTSTTSTTVPQSTTSTTVPTYLIPPLVWERPTAPVPAPVAPPAKVSVTG